MPQAIETAFVQQFKTNVELVMQQKEARLRPLVTTDSYQAKSASVVEQFGVMAAQKVTTRNAPTPVLDLDQSRRWVFPTTYVASSTVDRFDKLKMAIDPTSPYVQAAAAAMARAQDAEIMSAFFGTAKVGENGTVDEAFDTTYEVASTVGGASSLNVAKLRAALKLLMKANQGQLNEPVYCAISAEDHDALLSEVQIASRDFNSQPVLEDGRIRRFLGMDFVVIESLPVSGSNRYIPVWVRSGMHLGVWEDVNTRIDERSDMNYATQIWLSTTVGATRLQQGKVVRIVVA